MRSLTQLSVALTQSSHVVRCVLTRQVDCPFRNHSKRVLCLFLFCVEFCNSFLRIVLSPPSVRLTALPPTVFCAVCRRYSGFCSGTLLYFAGMVPYFTASDVIDGSNLTDCSDCWADCWDSSCSPFSLRLFLSVHHIIHKSGRCYVFDVTVSCLRSLKLADSDF